MNPLLRRPVLVLNRFWQPVQTCSARHALKLLCLGHAEILQTQEEGEFQTHDFDSWCDYSSSGAMGELVHTVKIALEIPRIIVLATYDKFPKLEVRLSRRNVFLRDQYTCQYCARVFAEQDLNLDHVMPRDKGGPSTWENLVTSCIRCNTRKANKLPKEANMHPLNPPVAPRWRPVFGLRGFQGPHHSSWDYFLRAEARQTTPIPA
ncbi:MAG: HNH endonuclease [Verrucomicrobiales bacterium]